MAYNFSETKSWIEITECLESIVPEENIRVKPSHTHTHTMLYNVRKRRHRSIWMCLFNIRCTWQLSLFVQQHICVDVICCGRCSSLSHTASCHQIASMQYPSIYIYIYMETTTTKWRRMVSLHVTYIRVQCNGEALVRSAHTACYTFNNKPGFHNANGMQEQGYLLRAIYQFSSHAHNTQTLHIYKKKTVRLLHQRRRIWSSTGMRVIVC